MDRKSRATSMRRAGSAAVGSLAIFALVAAPAMAHARIDGTDQSRQVLLAAELVGADTTEAPELESMLQVEDAQVQAGTGDVSGTDATSGDQLGTDQPDATSGDQQGTDQPDATSGDQSGTEQPDATSGDQPGAEQPGATSTDGAAAPDASGTTSSADGSGSGSPDATDNPDGGSNGGGSSH